jgi:hypothetical protein
VRTRAPFPIRLGAGLLAGGLAIGAAVVVGRPALDRGRDAPAGPAAIRADATDPPGPGALVRARDPFESERDPRRVDVGTLATALVLVAVACWWIAADRRATHVGSVRPLATRPRAPPGPPAPVCT